MRIVLILLLLAAGLSRAQNSQRWEFIHAQMGTEFRVITHHPDSAVVADAVARNFAWLDSLNQQLSDYLPESELMRLSSSAPHQRSQPVSADLWRVLQEGQRIAEISGGAFDLTVGPLSQVWRRAFRREEFPEFERIMAARDRVSFEYLVLVPDSQAVRLLRPDMQLDLGGIAKGYAAEIMLERLTEAGLPHSLVDAGGDLAIGYPPPGESGWKVAPLWPDEELDALYLENIAIATSGSTYRYLTWEGQRYSHIIDPRSGYGVSQQRLVTVMTRSATLADALASLVSVMGGDAFPLAERIVAADPLQIWLWEHTPKGWILVEFSNE